MVTTSLNEEFEKFCQRNPDFDGRVAILGHSLGGIITFDILSNQRKKNGDGAENVREGGSPSAASIVEREGGGPAGLTPESSSPTTPTPISYEISYPRLKFRPQIFLSLGSPLSATMIMRGQTYEAHHPPSWCLYRNVFHLYDPLAYRIEPLIDPEYAKIPPVLLKYNRTARRRFTGMIGGVGGVGVGVGETFNQLGTYYFRLLSDYFASSRVPAMMPSIPSMPSMPSMPSIPSMPSMPSMPSIPSMPSMPSMPSLPSLPLPLPTLSGLPMPTISTPTFPALTLQFPSFEAINRQFSVMIEGVFANGEVGVGHGHKRKRGISTNDQNEMGVDDVIVDEGRESDNEHEGVLDDDEDDHITDHPNESQLDSGVNSFMDPPPRKRARKMGTKQKNEDDGKGSSDVIAIDSNTKAGRKIKQPRSRITGTSKHIDGNDHLSQHQHQHDQSGSSAHNPIQTLPSVTSNQTIYISTVPKTTAASAPSSVACSPTKSHSASALPPISHASTSSSAPKRSRSLSPTPGEPAAVVVNSAGGSVSIVAHVANQAGAMLRRNLRRIRSSIGGTPSVETDDADGASSLGKVEGEEQESLLESTGDLDEDVDLPRRRFRSSPPPMNETNEDVSSSRRGSTASSTLPSPVMDDTATTAATGATKPLKTRLDYFVQETVIDNLVHQYLVGLRAHFAYWSDKDIAHNLITLLNEGHPDEIGTGRSVAIGVPGQQA
ncbi:hypothetical protein HK102_004897 [Quaeritorhiza haematococci]|nr:hypothetical protein HK102_004897 [Quaeritorhiza haematococci]